MVADTLTYHPVTAHYLRYVATTVGRDKLLRTLQYFARFYAWYLYRTNAKTASIKPWEALKKQFGLTRKAMRIGKNIEHLKAAAAAYDRKDMDPVLRYCAVGRQLGYAAYLSLDVLVFLDGAGIRPTPNGKKLGQDAYRGWMVGLIFNIIAGSYTLYSLREREKGLDKKDGEGVVESKKIQRERSAARIQLVSDLCDLTVPTTALGYSNFDDGFVGLAGTTSSLIGVWATWKKTA